MTNRTDVIKLTLMTGEQLLVRKDEISAVVEDSDTGGCELFIRGNNGDCFPLLEGVKFVEFLWLED